MWLLSAGQAGSRLNWKNERAFPKKPQTAIYRQETESGRPWLRPARRKPGRKEWIPLMERQRTKERWENPISLNSDAKTDATGQKKKKRKERQTKPRTNALIVKPAQAESYTNILGEIRWNAPCRGSLKGEGGESRLASSRLRRRPEVVWCFRCFGYGSRQKRRWALH